MASDDIELSKVESKESDGFENDLSGVGELAKETSQENNIQQQLEQKRQQLQQQEQQEQQQLRQSRFEKGALYILDHIFCGLVIGPLTVLAWRGAWNLLTYHLIPENPGQSGFTCFAIGNAGLMLLVLIEDWLRSKLNKNNWVHWLFGYHLYTLVCFFFNVCHWRGMWVILDTYTGNIDQINSWACFAIGQGFLMLFRATKNAQAPPMIVCIDYDQDFFAYRTKFRTKRKPITELYLWDVFCSVFVVHQFVVFYWRGAWNLTQVYIFPNNSSWSANYCLVIAACLLVLVTILQPILNQLYRRTENMVIRWFLETFLYLLSNFINVCTWRGIWLILDEHVLPDRPSISCLITLVAGMAGLMLLLAGNSVTVRCVDMDGDLPADQGCYCPTFYFRYLINTYRNIITRRKDSERGSVERGFDRQASSELKDVKKSSNLDIKEARKSSNLDIYVSNNNINNNSDAKTMENGMSNMGFHDLYDKNCAPLTDKINNLNVIRERCKNKSDVNINNDQECLENIQCHI